MNYKLFLANTNLDEIQNALVVLIGLNFNPRGEVEILIDQGGYKEQFPEMWSEMKRLLPELLPPYVMLSHIPREFVLMCFIKMFH